MVSRCNVTALQASSFELHKARIVKLSGFDNRIFQRGNQLILLIMSKQLRRQERIVAWLNRDWIWTSKTASKEFGVHQKTIKNDIKDLKARGYKIEWDVARRSYTMTEKGGSLVAGARFRESHLKAITQAANIFEDMGYNESATTMRSLADSYQTALPELLEADKDLLIRTLWL